MNNQNQEQTSTSHARIKLPTKISEPIYLKIEDLEAIQEEYKARRRTHIDDVKSRGWA